MRILFLLASFLAIFVIYTSALAHHNNNNCADQNWNCHSNQTHHEDCYNNQMHHEDCHSNQTHHEDCYNNQMHHRNHYYNNNLPNSGNEISNNTQPDDTKQKPY